MKSRVWAWSMLISANVVAWGMLSFEGESAAAPQATRGPFDNSVQQRNEMIRELQEIKALLKEQNALLRAGANKTASHDRSKSP